MQIMLLQTCKNTVIMPDHKQAKKSKFPVRKANVLAHCSRFPLFRKAAMFLLDIYYLSGNNLRQVVPTRASVTKQYKLVPVKCGDALQLRR